METIYTKKGEEFYVDDDDYLYLSQFTWCSTSNGYASHTIGYRNSVGSWSGFSALMHKVITGSIFLGHTMEVDHIDHNINNNSKSNLRIVTLSQNKLNRVNPASKTGIRGVSEIKDGYYQAKTRVNGHAVYIYSGSDKEMAISKYKEFVSRVHGEFYGEHKRLQTMLIKKEILT